MAEPEPAEAPAAQADQAPAAQPQRGSRPQSRRRPRRSKLRRAPAPEIPGADLIPDIVPEGEEFLDAEARAAAEAEAEEAARVAEEDAQEEHRPIADAAIDLAAGARYTATGKRKTAVARVILKPGTGTYSINGKDARCVLPTRHAAARDPPAAGDRRL